MGIFRLPCDQQELRMLTDGQVIAAIWVRRMFIRNHRDQTGDDRCFLDDHLVWQLLSDTPPEELLTAAEGMQRCREFHAFRNADGVDTLPAEAILDPDRWDDDLWHRSRRSLDDELGKLQEAIRTHRDIAGRPRTADDDRALYLALPEKLPADFRLPPADEFLGEARAPHAGCPAFWRSHAGCEPGRCSQHRWGPC